MTAMQAEAVEREVRIDAPPETVYAFLTDADRIVRWMGRKATLEARPGGTAILPVELADGREECSPVSEWTFSLFECDPRLFEPNLGWIDLECIEVRSSLTEERMPRGQRRRPV